MSRIHAIGLSPKNDDMEAAAGDGSEEQVVDVDDDCDDAEQAAGSRKTHKMVDPCKEEINEHEKTHLPYRNSCRHCVSGRGKEMSHVKSKNKHNLPEVHFGFVLLAGRASWVRLSPYWWFAKD